MTITYQDLQQFHLFAVGKVTGGGAESVTQLAAEWEALREDETMAELRRRAADMEAGIGRPLREVDKELRAKHGFSPLRDS